MPIDSPNVTLTPTEMESFGLGDTKEQNFEVPLTPERKAGQKVVLINGGAKVEHKAWPPKGYWTRLESELGYPLSVVEKDAFTEAYHEAASLPEDDGAPPDNISRIH